MSKELQRDALVSKKKKRASNATLPDLIKDLLDKSSIPVSEKKDIALRIASYFKAPLPSSEVLLEYADAVEDGAERIFYRYEMQMQHRMNLEDYLVKEEMRLISRGQLFAFILSVFGLLLSGALACLGHEIVAAIIGGSTIVSLTATFVAGKISQKR